MSDGFQWSALATAITAVVALIVGVAAIIQRSRSENRAEWWRRLQWAIECTQNEKRASVRESGLAVLLHLIKSPLARDEDVRLARDVARQVLARHGGGR